MSIDPQTGLPVQQPPRSGGCFRSCLTMGCLGTIAIAVCCGVAGVGFKSAIKVESNAQIAGLVGSNLVQDGLLGEFDAPQSYRITAPVIGEFVKFSVRKRKDGAALLLGEFGPGANVEGSGFDVFAALCSEQLELHSGVSKANVTRVTERIINVRGTPAKFSIAEASIDGPPVSEIWQVSGSLRGEQGSAFLYLILPHEAYTEDKIVQAIESIK